MVSQKFSNSPNMYKELLTIQEVSEILQCHPNTLRKWDKLGIIRAVRFGKRGDRRYYKDSLFEVLQSEGKNPKYLKSFINAKQIEGTLKKFYLSVLNFMSPMTLDET